MDAKGYLSIRSRSPLDSFVGQSQSGIANAPFSKDYFLSHKSAMAPMLELLEKPSVKSVSAVSNGTFVAAGLRFESAEKHQRVLNVFRAFIADLVQQYNDGHPG